MYSVMLKHLKMQCSEVEFYCVCFSLVLILNYRKTIVLSVYLVV